MRSARCMCSLSGSLPARRSVSSARGIARVAAAGALLALAGLSACDPCASVSGCADQPRVAIQGTIVDAANGHAVPNTLVALVRTDGGTRDFASTITNGEGTYQISL